MDIIHTMRISLEWLKEFVNIDLPAEEIARKLTMTGHEVEAVERTEGDVLFEVNVTPNRPDCLSMLGIARELSAVYGIPVKLPVRHLTEEGTSADFKVEILDDSLCHRYAGRVIAGVKVSESPPWIKNRLEKCGLRTINNVVDITNYVLLELGHPMHAFDARTISGKTIKIGPAGTSDKITTIDGRERQLFAGALLIRDGKRPVALAGIMGGSDTEVSDDTRDIFLEAAYFEPVSIRETSKKLGLKTESSYRFERGADIEMLVYALDRASLLINQIAGGKAAMKIDEYPRRFKAETISVSYEKVNRALGTDISSSKMLDIAGRLGLAPEAGADCFSVRPQAYRHDMRRDADVIEEIARLYGYENIPVKRPVAVIAAHGRDKRHEIISETKDVMCKAGFYEAINFSFMNESSLNMLEIQADDRRRKSLTVRNPLRLEDSLLRTILLPSLLENFNRNFSHGVRDIRLFEISRIFESIDRPLPSEILMLAGIYSRDRLHQLWKESASDFYLVKGVIESLFDDLGIKDISYSKSEEPFLHPGQSSDVYAGGTKIGYVGVISPLITRKLGLKTSSQEIVVFEIDMDKLILLGSSTRKYTPVPRFPYVERDISIILDEDIMAGDIIKLIKAYPSDLIESAAVFDFYKGRNIDEGKKSLAFTLRYRSKGKTLTGAEVEALHENLIRYLVNRTGGEIRR